MLFAADILSRWGVMQGHAPKIISTVDLSIDEIKRDSFDEDSRKNRHRYVKNLGLIQTMNSFEESCAVSKVKPDILQGVRDAANINNVMKIWVSILLLWRKLQEKVLFNVIFLLMQ